MLAKNRILVDEHRLCFISFENIFKRIEIQLLNDLNEYCLIKNNKIDLRNRDTKKFLYHNIIHTLSSTVIRYRNHYKCDVVVVYDTIFKHDSEICNFVDCNILYKQLSTILSKIQTILPINIIKNTDKIDKTYFNTGEGIELIQTLSSKINNSNKTKNFSKIYDFTVKYELTFLNENYFNKMTTKHLLI